MTSYLLGVDLGTSGIKVVLLRPDGSPGEDLPSITVELALDTPRAGWSEQDPADWWSAAIRAIRRLLEETGIDGAAVSGLALSGQMHGATLLDGHGDVLRPCILWNDQRSGAQCEAITRQIGLERLLQSVGNPALAGFTLPKLIWVRENEPDVYARVANVLLPKDYINYRLTGEIATEVSDASGTLLFDVAQRRWSDSLARELDIPTSILPPVHDSTDIMGRVTSEAASLTGLQAGTPVVAGGADNACAAVGMGVVRAGHLLVSIGTSGTVVAPSAEPHVDPAGRLHTFCHAVPDTWYAMGVVLSAGGSLRWLRDVLFVDESTEGVYDLLMQEASTIPPGSEGLIFLPYLTGERTPHGDPNARGVFFGLSLRHSRAHLVRATVEGITFALGDSAALMRDIGIDVSTVRAAGGGARSGLWRQILADVFDATVLTAAADTGPAFGAAILAGIGTGAFPSVGDAVQRLVPTGSETTPDSRGSAAYLAYQRLYDSLYPALRDTFAAAAVLEVPISG